MTSLKKKKRVKKTTSQKKKTLEKWRHFLWRYFQSGPLPVTSDRGQSLPVAPLRSTSSNATWKPLIYYDFFLQWRHFPQFFLTIVVVRKNCGKNDVMFEKKTRGKIYVTEEKKRRKNDVTSVTLLPVRATSDRGRSLLVAPPPQMLLENLLYTTFLFFSDVIFPKFFLTIVVVRKNCGKNDVTEDKKSAGKNDVTEEKNVGEMTSLPVRASSGHFRLGQVTSGSSTSSNATWKPLIYYSLLRSIISHVLSTSQEHNQPWSVHYIINRLFSWA